MNKSFAAVAIGGKVYQKHCTDYICVVFIFFAKRWLKL